MENPIIKLTVFILFSICSVEIYSQSVLSKRDLPFIMDHKDFNLLEIRSHSGKTEYLYKKDSIVLLGKLELLFPLDTPSDATSYLAHMNWKSNFELNNSKIDSTLINLANVYFSNSEKYIEKESICSDCKYVVAVTYKKMIFRNAYKMIKETSLGNLHEILEL